MPSAASTLKCWVKTNKVILALLLILALASFLRIYDLGTESLWYDEVHSIRVSGQNFVSVIRGAAVGKHTPLYFIGLHFWTGFLGDSEVSLRSPSAIFGILSVLIIYWVGCALFNRKVGLISSLLSAISLFHIHYSQEARPYSLLLLLSLLSFLFFIKILKQDKKWHYPCYLLCNILLCYTHIFGLFTIAAQIFFLLLFWAKYKLQRLKLLCVQEAAIVAILPLALLLGHVTISLMQHGFWIPEPALSSIWNTIYAFCGSRYSLVVIFLCLVVIAPFSIRKMEGRWLLRRPLESLKGISRNIKPEAIEEFVLLAIWLFLPLVLAFAISKITTPLYVTRYLIGASPALYLLVAKGLSELNIRKVIYPILIIIVILSSPGLANYYTKVNKAQWREVAGLVELNSRENDVAIFCAGQIPFNYYYHGELTKFGIDRNVEDTQELAAFVNDATSGKERLWLIISQTVGHNPYMEGYLIDRYGSDSLLLEQEFVGVRVLLFDVK